MKLKQKKNYDEHKKKLSINKQSEGQVLQQMHKEMLRRVGVLFETASRLTPSSKRDVRTSPFNGTSGTLQIRKAYIIGTNKAQNKTKRQG
jgi:hypothetical protein